MQFSELSIDDRLQIIILCPPNKRLPSQNRASLVNDLRAAKSLLIVNCKRVLYLVCSQSGDLTPMHINEIWRVIRVMADKKLIARDLNYPSHFCNLLPRMSDHHADSVQATDFVM